MPVIDRKVKPLWAQTWPPTAVDAIGINMVAAPSVPIRAGASEYSRYVASRQWRLIRAVCLVMSGWKCAKCGGRAEEVHHRTYRRFQHERWEDIEPVCQRCHAKRHPHRANSFSGLTMAAYPAKTAPLVQEAKA